MNQLKVNEQQVIRRLLDQGWSLRRVARELGIHRRTVRRYADMASSKCTIPTAGSGASDDLEQDSKCTIPTAGSGASDGLEQDAKCTIPTAGPNVSEGAVDDSKTSLPSADAPETSRAGRLSFCEPFRSVIEEACEQGLSAQRIYQDLVNDHGFTSSYESVKRFVRRLRATDSLPFRRMETEPGMEAQVDFGQGAWVVVDGKRRRPHILRVILSHSRKGYNEVVWKQTTELFIRCLENAFRSFGGVPATLVIDNLRAAVKKADWFEPELNPKVRSFSEHYSTAILPTKVATPRHKGKIEAGVKYVQNNAIKGRQFSSLAQQNQFLWHWERTIADTRIHGTTRKQVGRCFLEIEKERLQSLPADLFPVFCEAPRKVHQDGYVEVDNAYYSVPPEYVGHRVWARWEPRLVRVYNIRMEQISVHARSEPGRHVSNPDHIHPHKRCKIERGAEWLLDRCGIIGKYTGSWAQAMYQNRGVQGLRVLQGLLQLAEKHPSAELEIASENALNQSLWHLRELKALLAQGPHDIQTDFLEEHPLIRNLEAYGNMVPVCFDPEQNP